MTHRASPFPYLNTLVSYPAERFRGVCFVACEEAERVAAALWLAVISMLASVACSRYTFTNRKSQSTAKNAY